MKKKIAVLPGDGIGKEIMPQALRVLEAIGKRFGHSFAFEHALIGGAAWEVHRTHFPKETEKVCREADAILFGATGGPVKDQHLEKWKNSEANSILALRKTFGLSASFRPARVYPQLAEICPLRPELLASGVDLLVVRELIGDIYFGEHRTFEEGGRRVATDVARYDEDQIRAVAKVAFEAAGRRRGKLTSVDKANVLDTSKLWRAVVHETAKDYPGIKLEDMLVDNCAMQIIRNPAHFDVIVTSNLFGDILSDAAAVLPGSLGLTPSASLNGAGFGLYEPSGGSAPDIAGQGTANPIAQILSASMMLRYSFGLIAESDCIDRGVEKALDSGARTSDIARPGVEILGTVEMGDAILSNL